MKTEPEDDEVINEMPVYLSKNLFDKLHIFQYPMRPSSHTYDDESFVKAQIKPQSQQVELELALRTRSPTYDRATGHQIAINVDGPSRDKKAPEDTYYSSDVMDKILLTSTNAVGDTSRYALGVVGDNALHLSPISSIYALRPSFSYLDLAERNRNDKKDHSDESDEEKTTKVSVRFAKPDTERSIMLREKSYNYLQRKIREEPWISLNYHKCGSEQSEFESQNLFCSYQNEIIDQFDLDEANYLKKLIPAPTEVKIANPGLPSHMLSRAALDALPLQERIRMLMVNAGVVSFSELNAVIAAGKKDEDPANVLRAVQQEAVLVQGNWVVKSDLLYPQNSKSESGVQSEILQKARDYVLYLFTKSSSVSRSEISEMLDIPGPDLTDILKGISKCRGGRGVWSFLLPTDHSFLKRYPDVFQRQQMIWQSRHEQLSHSLKEKVDSKVSSSRKAKIKPTKR